MIKRITTNLLRLKDLEHSWESRLDLRALHDKMHLVYRDTQFTLISLLFINHWIFLPFFNRTLLCGFLFLVRSELQFHRWDLNWYWHSSTAASKPCIATAVTSGYLRHRFCWTLLNPGNVLQMVQLTGNSSVTKFLRLL